MNRTRVVVANELRMLAADPFPIILLVFMPLIVCAFVANGFVGGPAFAVPGIGVLFAFMSLFLIAFAFFRDHKWNTWDRIRVSPVSPVQIVLGKLAPLALLLMVQQVVLLGAGRMMFGMPWRGSLGPAALLIVALVVVEMALGFFLTVACRTVNQVSAFSNLGGLVLGGIGGALAPLNRMPEWVEALAPISPVYWYLRGIRGVVLGTASGTSIAVATGILLGFGVVFALLSAVRFRMEERKVFFA